MFKSTNARWFAAGLVGLVCTLSAASSIASGQAGEAEGRAVGDSDAAAMASRIDEILTGLERRGDGVSDIRCQVRLTEEDKVNLTEGIKFGSILFMITEPNPHFLIHFEKSEKDGIVGRQEWFLFDGRWLWEASERQKQVIKRQIVRPAEKLDLFDLERAPFPVPFGQKKETILRNFDVSLSPPEASDPPNTDHLVCIPRPDSAMYRKYERLEFFVNRDLHLPTKIVVTKNEGHEVISAVFPDLSEKSINAQVKREDFAPPAAWRKYKEVVETMDGGAP